jgi:hypothetical protein
MEVAVSTLQVAVQMSSPNMDPKNRQLNVGGGGGGGDGGSYCNLIEPWLLCRYLGQEWTPKSDS